MLFRSSAHPGKAVRLGYCMNLHAAETLDELLANMLRITLPLRERIAPKCEFGVGMYLPARLARELANNPLQLACLKQFLDEHGLDSFTYNAFPYGDFQTDGLKERVFEPTWSESARMAYTLDVAEVATRLTSRNGIGEHISISTHCGAHSSHFADSRERQRKTAEHAASFLRAAESLSQLEDRSGRRVVLSLESEPRSSCNDLLELGSLLGSRIDCANAAVRRHVGVCLDLCHAAVEFELEAGSNDLWLHHAVGKLQFSSALALRDPDANAQARIRFFGMDEPRFLHQVTGVRRGQYVRAGDIVEVNRGWERGDDAWHGHDEWRCHFHVPVDLEYLGDDGLTTTRSYSDRQLTVALAAASSPRWRLPELHVEIETYTWHVLPREVRGAGELVDGLEREYRHVIAVLENAGWKHASS